MLQRGTGTGGNGGAPVVGERTAPSLSFPSQTPSRTVTVNATAVIIPHRRAIPGEGTRGMIASDMAGVGSEAAGTTTTMSKPFPGVGSEMTTIITVATTTTTTAASTTTTASTTGVVDERLGRGGASRGQEDVMGERWAEAAVGWVVITSHCATRAVVIREGIRKVAASGVVPISALACTPPREVGRLAGHFGTRMLRALRVPVSSHLTQHRRTQRPHL